MTEIIDQEMSEIVDQEMSEIVDRFIITFDEEDFDSDVEDCEDDLCSLMQRLEVEVDENEQKEIEQWLKIQQQTMEYYDLSKFENYVRWYVTSMQGTLEQPYILWDDHNDILTARSYYKAKENRMIEMRLLFDDSQVERVKEFLVQIGFVFENLNSMFPDTSYGSVHDTRQFIDKDGDMVYAFNSYNCANRRTSEMRIVFNAEQLQEVFSMLKVGGFRLSI
jgi:hypothetical protein